MSKGVMDSVLSQDCSACISLSLHAGGKLLPRHSLNFSAACHVPQKTKDGAGLVKGSCNSQ